jgi:omega-6 fatty acid desaturase (delta-12 desaturase)
MDPTNSTLTAPVGPSTDGASQLSGDDLSADCKSAATNGRPSVPEVRGQVPTDVRSQSLVRGLTSFSVAAALYGLTLWGALAAPWWPLQIVCALFNGLFIATIFVVGHDACHGGLTPYEALNQLLGRLAFLPSLTPYITWEFAHNRIHHSYTNWRGKDYAWAPFSKEEYDRLSPMRRFMERHYRSLLGLGTYYLYEYWWKHLLLLSKQERQEMKRPLTYALDFMLVVAFLVAEIALVVLWANTLEPSEGFWGAFTSPAALLVVGLLVPFLGWNWFMSFAIFQHHNHPRVAWFNDKNEWDFFAGQVESTTHIIMPWFLEFATAHIMQHTAHHVDARIPLYRLEASQGCLEQAYQKDIVVERWTFTTLGKTLAKCQLYDFENHRWLNFRGKPTSLPNEALMALREGSAPARRKSK